MHRERGTLARRLLEQLGVVQHDVGADDRLDRIEEPPVPQRVEPLLRVVLDVVGVEYDVARRVLVAGGRLPPGVDVLSGAEQLVDDPIEVGLERPDGRLVEQSVHHRTAVSSHYLP